MPLELWEGFVAIWPRAVGRRARANLLETQRDEERRALCLARRDFGPLETPATRLLNRVAL